jgi:hypothetical protein
MRTLALRGLAGGTPAPRGLRGRDGQALLVAVLLMTVILLIGILFAALVSYNQGQSARHVDTVAAQQSAEAGVNYANDMLQHSPQGADWRPHFVAYNGTGAEVQTDNTTWPQDPALWPSPPAMYADGSVDYNFWGVDGIEGTEDDYYSDFDMVRGWYSLRDGSNSAPGRFLRLGFNRYPDPNQLGTSRDNEQFGRGYFLLQVTYDPDPPYEPGETASQDRMSNCIQIVSLGRAVQDSNVFRRLVAYKPIGLTDHMLWITNQSGGAAQATVGVRPNVDLNASGAWEGTGESLFSNLMGPIRSEATLYWAAGDTDTSGTVGPSTYFRLRTVPAVGEGYLRDDVFEAPLGLYALDPDTADCARLIVTGGATTDVPVPNAVAPTDISTPNRIVTGSQNVTELLPVELNPTDPISGQGRYHALTRDSGPMVRATATDVDHDIAVDDPVNVGLYGHGPGMYVDNDNDLQYRGSDGRSNLAALLNDWLRSPQGQGYAGSASGWNATFTTYTPPGVEIEFFPSEDAVLATVTDDTLSGDDAPPAAAGRLWWPNHTAGAPGIKLTRHDRRWRRGDYTGGAWHVGEDSGRNVIVIDYPAYPNQVIFAEGNVRVKGVLPARDRTVSALDRSFDMTVVSNGTIYIDGQLMTYQDVAGRRQGTTAPGTGILDEDTAKVALLARDYVCLNPTQLVAQLTSGLVTAAADDEANPTIAAQHWELFPNTGGAVYSQWRWGWPDADTNNDGVGEGTPGVGVDLATRNIFLTPIHAGADPGPSGMAMTVYNEDTQTTVPFTFPGTGGAIDPYTFIFVPPGALLADSIPTPTPYASNAIAPQWQIEGSTPANTFADPAVPFNITPNVSSSIGYLNAVSLFHRDPQIGTGSTAYLIKKWKLEETAPRDFALTAGGAVTYQIPHPAVHAHVNALMLAQRGCWFVIPGTYFDEDAVTRPDYDVNAGLSGANGTTVSAVDSLYAARFRRYNYEIVVRGTITQDHTAPLEAQQTWTNRWAFPLYSDSGGSLELAWGTIRYEFDDRLRVARDQSLTTLTGNERRAAGAPDTVQGLLPKLPCLPTSPTLIYAGGTLN